MTGELWFKLRNKKYREAYVSDHIAVGVPYQIRTVRMQRKWSQAELGRRTKSKKPQNVISRLEDPNYGKLTLQTLKEVVSALDAALLIKIVPFSRFIAEHENVSPEALKADSFAEEDAVIRRSTNQVVDEEGHFTGLAPVPILIDIEQTPPAASGRMMIHTLPISYQAVPSFRDGTSQLDR